MDTGMTYRQYCYSLYSVHGLIRIVLDNGLFSVIGCNAVLVVDVFESIVQYLSRRSGD